MIYTYKFNKDSKAELSDLRDSKLWEIKTKLESGVKLSLDEKVWLNEKCNIACLTPRGTAALMGWAFDFSDYLTRYVYLQYGEWREYWAVDKTSLRKTIYGGMQIKYILEVK
jgi:hypothetical protein